MSENEPGQTKPSIDEFQDVRELLAAGNKIGAITRLREHTDLSLADAMKYVEALEDPTAASGPSQKRPFLRRAGREMATPPPASAITGWKRWVFWFVVSSWSVIGIMDLARGHVLEGIRDLALAAIFATILGVRFGLRGRALTVVGWSMLLVCSAITILRWMGRV